MDQFQTGDLIVFSEIGILGALTKVFLIQNFSFKILIFLSKTVAKQQHPIQPSCFGGESC